MKATRSTALDTSLQIAAPEYIVFENRLAGPTIRFLAVLLDHILFLVIIFIIVFILILASIFNFFKYMETLSGAAMFVFFILLFLLYWFYFFLQEYFMRGRTIGKLALGLRVISLDGTSLDFFQVFLRNLLRFADMFPVEGGFFPAYTVGLCSMFLDPRAFRRLGDLAAGTIVIRDKRTRRQPEYQFENRSVQTLAADMQIKHPPSVVLARALHDFAVQTSRLHPQRLQEIASRVYEPIARQFGINRELYPDLDPVHVLLAAHTVLFQLERDTEARLGTHRGPAE
ncbi:MAG: RDD family protein [Leptospiraceae bacterium]|nr:RDD family protein [Leptospiraceae bacterium]